MGDGGGPVLNAPLYHQKRKEMKTVILNILQSPAFKTTFKMTAIIKYLFFPFLVAQSQVAPDYSTITNGQTVNAVTQTESATWLATNNGIWKINKANGKALHITEANSVLPSNHVTGITSTYNGNVYATTDKGIFRFDGYAFLVLDAENSNLPDVKFTSIVCDRDDNLWVATEGKGLILMNGYKTKSFNVRNSALSTDNIASISIDSNGTIYALLSNHDVLEISDKGIKLITASTIEIPVLAKS